METVVKRQESRDKTDANVASQDSRRGSSTANNVYNEGGTKSEKTFAGTLQSMFSTLPKKDRKDKPVVSATPTSHIAPHHKQMLQANRNVNGNKTGTGAAFPGLNCGQEGDDDTSTSSISDSPGVPMGRQHSYNILDKHPNISTKGRIKGKIGIGHGAPSTMSLDDTSSDDSTYSSQVK
jgi:hypothetical protein